MGGVIQTVFGGSKNKNNSTQTSTSVADSSSHSESGNQAYDYLMDAMSPNVGLGNSAFSQIGALLGVGGDKGAADAGYQNFMKSSGYQNIFDQAMKAVTGSGAAKGMLNSGATLKALQNRGGDLAQQSFGNYLGQLGSMFSGGQQSAATIGGAGGYSNSDSTSHSTSNSTGQSSGSGSSSPGIFSQLFPAGLSDRRLKTFLEPLGINPQGLTVYRFEFINRPGKQIGVMADEVAMAVPAALGPKHGMYDTVQYDLIEPLDGHPFTAPMTAEELFNGGI